MKKISLVGILVFCFLVTDLQAQKSKSAQMKGNVWQTLSLVTRDRKFDEMLGFDVEVPNFSAAVKKLEGKEITLHGYILPLEGRRSQKYFIFSAYPYNLCYFCGGAGPETVAEVYAKEPIKYTTKRITIKGKLVLNNSGDMERMFYVIHNARIVK